MTCRAECYPPGECPCPTCTKMMSAARQCGLAFGRSLKDVWVQAQREHGAKIVRDALEALPR